tara:strand:- start:262 stop:528 length:267 start_codon:yes stop_codon:yes gene_type:complete
MANITTTGFANEAVSINKSDTFDSTTILNGAALYVGTGGDVAVVMQGITGSLSNDVIFKNVPSGTFLPISIDFLCSTGTTADDFLKIG